MAENKELQKTPEVQYSESLDFDDSVVEKIVAITCQEVDGIVEMKGGILSAIQEGFGGTDFTKGVDVELVEKMAEINLSIIMEYGKEAPKIFNELKSVITRNIKEMTGLGIRELNVRVVDVLTRDEIQKRQKQAREEEQKSAE